MANLTGGSEAIPLGLSEEIISHLGVELRKLYADPLEQKVPVYLRRLRKRAFQVLRARHEPVSEAFVAELMSLLPEVRRFALSLTRDLNHAEDLIQETVLRALSQHERYAEGTNLRAWLFTILRNLFFTGTRRGRREVEDPDGSLALALSVLPDQEDKLVHQKLASAFGGLRTEFQEVLSSVFLEGLSYEETAVRAGCAVGTVKSRVNRARKQ